MTEESGAQPGQGPLPRADGSVEIIDLLLIVWRRKGTIVAGTLLVVLAAYVVFLLTPPTYEATVTLLVAESKLGELDVLPAQADTFRALLRSREIVVGVVDEFDLDQAPLNINWSGFLAGNLEIFQSDGILEARVRLGNRDIVADVANSLAERAVAKNRRLNQEDTVATRDFILAQVEESQTRREELEQQLVDLKRSARIDELRSEVAALTRRLVALGDERFALEKNIAWQDEDQAPARLAAARDDLLGYQTEAELPRVEAALEFKLLEKSILEQQQTNLRIDIESESARLTQSESEIVDQPELLEFITSIDTQPALLEAARVARSDAQDLLGLALRNQVLNPTHQSIAIRIVDARIQPASLNEQLDEVRLALSENATALRDLQAEVFEKRAMLRDKQQAFDLASDEYRRLLETNPAAFASRLGVVTEAQAGVLSELTRKQADLYQREVALASLEIDHSLVQGTYRDVTSQYEQARIQVASRSAQLQVFDRALPPNGSVAPRLVINLALGFLAGLLLSMIAVILMEYIGTQQTRQRA